MNMDDAKNPFRAPNSTNSSHESFGPFPVAEPGSLVRFCDRFKSGKLSCQDIFNIASVFVLLFILVMFATLFVRTGRMSDELRGNNEKGTIPIGFIYSQLPFQKAPHIIWPSFKWGDITANYSECKEGSTNQIQSSSTSFAITSPNYPEPYPYIVYCAWRLITIPGHRIKLNFDDFNIESHANCSFDYVIVNDGPSIRSASLGKFCGSQLPHTLVSSTNNMYMLFKSDAATQLRGFKAVHRTLCGGTLQATFNVKNFYSHAEYGYSDYDKREECSWVIKAPSKHRVGLKFLSFELEAGKDCRHDYVEINDGEDPSAPLLGKYCGRDLPPEFLSTGKTLHVQFHSDDIVMAKGFSVAYYALNADEGEPNLTYNGSQKAVLSASETMPLNYVTRIWQWQK